MRRSLDTAALRPARLGLVGADILLDADLVAVLVLDGVALLRLVLLLLHVENAALVILAPVGGRLRGGDLGRIGQGGSGQQAPAA